MRRAPPAWMSSAATRPRAPADGIAPIGERQLARAVGGAAEDGIHEPGGSAAACPGETHARVDGGVRRDAVEEEELVEAQPERRADRRVQPLERRPHEGP